jgi:sorting nexin-1/2
LVVHRRFREFLTLNERLGDSNPGVIVPPPPEKHAIGRFEEDFVENRRVLLERMLRKIAKHPILQKDPDFRMFLEADDLKNHVRIKCVIMDMS